MSFISYLISKDFYGKFCENNRIDDFLNESATRYSVEVNYRTTKKELLEGFAKLILGYVSAAIKKHNYHTKQIFENKPLRIIVSSRNWDDGEWVGMVSYNAELNEFIITKGYYNKMDKTVSIISSKKSSGNSAAEIAKELYEMMIALKNEPDRHTKKMNPVHLKRGPK